MLTVKQIKPGIKIKVLANGEEHTNIIIEMQNGRVVLGAVSGRGRWWLSVDHVKAFGSLAADRSSDIMKMRQAGLTYREIGANFGLSRQRIYKIIQAQRVSGGAPRDSRLGASPLSTKITKLGGLTNV